MKKMLFLVMILLSAFFSWSQTVTNVIFIGNKGATKHIKQAHSFIIVKKYPTGLFERKDYNLRGPLKIMRTYSDSSMQELHGMYGSFRPNGFLELFGSYKAGKKENKWFHFNDTGKVVLVETFRADSLVHSEIPLEKQKTDKLKEGEKLSEYQGGPGALKKFLVKNLNANIALQSVKGGQIRVGFKINPAGNVVDIHVTRSVEFVLDEEGLAVISKMPDWIPAEKDGIKLDAWRIQPVTFVKSK
jgi:TonB family protein